MDNTVKRIQDTIESMETKREELEKKGKDNYADEIERTFRPSAKLFLAAWEDLLREIDEEEETDNNSTNHKSNVQNL